MDFIPIRRFTKPADNEDSRLEQIIYKVLNLSNASMLNLYRLIPILFIGGFLLLSCSLPSKMTDKTSPANKVELVVADFDADELQLWQERSFKGNTVYSIVQEEGHKVVRADTKSTASALFRQMDINLKKTPFLNWSWRVDNIYNIDNAETRQGDDYAARIYVVVQEGPLPWDTKAINYVWCNNKTDKEYWPNPFSADSIMIPVRCGVEGLGQWHYERVNVANDFYRAFNMHIERAHGVAIMSDSDNAGGSALAYYGNIKFSN